jgi:hypothetical protein
MARKKRPFIYKPPQCLTEAINVPVLKILPIIYKIVKVEGELLVSPYAVKNFKETYWDGKQFNTIPYAFGYDWIGPAAQMIDSKTYYVYDGKLELWKAQAEEVFSINYQLNSYRLFTFFADQKESISQNFFEDNIDLLPPVGMVVAKGGTVICRNMKLLEKVKQNY